MINALSPLDSRYQEKIAALRPFFSEEALTKYRILVELRYFQMLSAEKSIRGLPSLTKKQHQALEKIVTGFTAKEAEKVKAIEKKTNHDVKAVEYYLKERLTKISGLKESTEFLHFGLTSEDVNNLAYGLMVHDALKHVILPSLRAAIGNMRTLANKWKRIPLLSLTHGQPATPTTVGEQFAVFEERLTAQLKQLQSFKMKGKFGGAVGNYSAHHAAYPDVPWQKIGVKFIRSLGLTPLLHTTQINPHDDLAELSHLLQRINTIGIDCSRDLWFYIMRGIFKQRVIDGEVGSSTMPHKVNPIDFENAEGNFGLSNALFGHFAAKLPISRMQRDLSDSTVQRNIGVAFGYHLLAVQSLQKGLSKISLDANATKKELEHHPEVYAEAIQMVLRKHGIPGYEKLKKLTRGEKVTKEQFAAFVDELEIPGKEKGRLLRIITDTPALSS